MLVYVRDGSAQTILRAVTLRKKLQIKRSIVMMIFKEIMIYIMDITRKILNRYFFIPAIGTIDCYHSVPFSVTLTMVWGHNVTAKQNLSAPFFCTLLICSD